MDGLVIKNLSIYHTDRVLAVSDVSFSVPKNEVKILMGGIGGGKSSILRAICGLFDYEGEIIFDGKDIGNLKIKDRNFVYASHDSPLLNGKTVECNLAYGSKLRRLNEKKTNKRIAEICGFFEISELLCRKVKTLSYYEKRQTIIARAFIRDADIYLLNDIARGLNETESTFLMHKINLLIKKNKVTTLVATSDYASVSSLGYNMILINGGKKICEGDADFYRNTPPDYYTKLFTESYSNE